MKGDTVNTLPLKQILEMYCLARTQRQTPEQLNLANALVDHYIPDLMTRYGQVIIERNAARAERDNLTDC
jgi:propanediol dehydratase small subunit